MLAPPQRRATTTNFVQQHTGAAATKLPQAGLNRYQQIMPRRALALFITALSLTACMLPPGPMERLTDSAYRLNVATRFGRMDIASDFVGQKARQDFARRHANWGSKIRIVDVELQGMRMMTTEMAEVRVTVRWHRIDETTMRASSIAQHWKQGSDDWALVEEIRVSGSPGLFGTLNKKPAPNGLGKNSSSQSTGHAASPTQ